MLCNYNDNYEWATDFGGVYTKMAGSTKRSPETVEGGMVGIAKLSQGARSSFRDRAQDQGVDAFKSLCTHTHPEARAWYSTRILRSAVAISRIKACGHKHEGCSLSAVEWSGWTPGPPCFVPRRGYPLTSMEFPQDQTRRGGVHTRQEKKEDPPLRVKKKIRKQSPAATRGREKNSVIHPHHTHPSPTKASPPTSSPKSSSLFPEASTPR